MDALAAARRWTTAAAPHGPACPPRITWWANRCSHLVTLALVAATLLAATTGCAPFGQPVPPTPTLDCALYRVCNVVTPPCGPVVMPAPGNTGLWYVGRQQARNVDELAGIVPLVPTWFPTRASWDSALLVGPQFGPGQAPLLREVYARWPYPRNGVVGTAPNQRAASVLDETTGTFGPLTGFGFVAAPFHVVEQRAATVGGLPATLYHLATEGVPASKYQITEELWHDGRLSLRLITAANGSWGLVRTSDTIPSSQTVLVPGWDTTIDLDADLLAIGAVPASPPIPAAATEHQERCRR